MRDSVLIATPAYGGLLHSKYVMSMVGTCRELARLGIQHGLFILPNDSLVSRDRNRCDAFALQHGFGSMVFVDADLGWTLDDFMAILMSDKPVIGGTYPIKQAEDPRLVYNPCEHDCIPAGVRPRSLEELRYLDEHCADRETGELQVRHVPTGFLKIDRAVLKKLRNHVPSYQQERLEGTGWETHHDFFPVRVSGNMYESEDWAFCTLVRQHLDCGVWLNTRVVLNHTGTFTYTAQPATPADPVQPPIEIGLPRSQASAASTSGKPGWLTVSA